MATCTQLEVRPGPLPADVVLIGCELLAGRGPMKALRHGPQLDLRERDGLAGPDPAAELAWSQVGVGRLFPVRGSGLV